MPQNSSDRDTFIRVTTIENLNIANMIDGVTNIWSLNKFDFLGTKISSSQTCLNLLNQTDARHFYVPTPRCGGGQLIFTVTWSQLNVLSITQQI